MEIAPLVVDLSLYTQNAVLKASYKFTADWYIELTQRSEQAVTVVFTPKAKGVESDLIRNEFLNELLDQTLRERIAAETLAVRNLIMAHALSQLDPIESSSNASSAQGK